MASNEPVFEIGLAMAGAISAGAYSSGVLDFLFQALDAWEQERARDPDAVPNHRVCIKVITGASAGSITGALAAASLSGGPRPAADAAGQKYVLPALYDAWVVKPDMASPGGGADMLDLSDLVPGKKVVSLLNADVLDRIGQEALQVPRPQRTRPYFSKRLHLYLTVSNLRGVPYKIAFKNSGEVRGHGMLNHGDRAHYVITGLGEMDRRSDWAEDDPGINLDVGTLPPPGTPLPPSWQDYLQAALSSSAFPIGLAARQLDRDTRDYRARMWPFPRDNSHDIDPDFPHPWCKPGQDRPYSFVNVDGGLINNEPFEFAHYALMEAGRIPNRREPDCADRAVILIDPFPEDPGFISADDKLDRSLVTVIKGMFSLLKDQARFKPSELAAALDETVYSRFLIAPRRSGPDGGPMRYSIATGLLGGFGGFLDRSLREFDYQLGRRNCQQFLRKAFAVDPNNPLVAGSTDRGMPGWSGTARRNPKFIFQDTVPAAGDAIAGTTQTQTFATVVPLVGSAAVDVELPPWPRLAEARLLQIVDRVVARAKVLAPRLIEEQLANRWLRFGAKTLWQMFGASMVQDYTRLAILQDLIRRDQYADWSFESEEERTVFAALCDPAFDFRTVKGIAATTALAERVVKAAIDRYQDRVYVASGAGPDGGDAYTLASRKPGWWSRNLGGLVRDPVIG